MAELGRVLQDEQGPIHPDIGKLKGTANIQPALLQYRTRSSAQDGMSSVTRWDLAKTFTSEGAWEGGSLLRDGKTCDTGVIAAPVRSVESESQSQVSCSGMLTAHFILR